MGLSATLNTKAEEKSFASAGDRTPVVQSVAIHYTDWAVNNARNKARIYQLSYLPCYFNIFVTHVKNNSKSYLMLVNLPFCIMVENFTFKQYFVILTCSQSSAPI
jgi:hypothetical protein